MKNNLMKECTSSYVVHIQESIVANWKIIFQRHLSTYRVDKTKIIFKTGGITITLYENQKGTPGQKSISKAMTKWPT